MKRQTGPIEPISFRDEKAFRIWLEKHHGTKKEIWLCLRKKNSSQSGLKYIQALEEALCFGWIDGILKSLDADSFLLRFPPRGKNSIWSKQNKTRAQKLIKDGRMTTAGLAKINQAKNNGQWRAAYASKDAPRLPSDLEAALGKSGLAWENFDPFSPSHKTQYIRWVIDARRKDTRHARIVKVVEYALKNKKPGMADAD